MRTYVRIDGVDGYEIRLENRVGERPVAVHDHCIAGKNKFIELKWAFSIIEHDITYSDAGVAVEDGTLNRERGNTDQR